MVGGGRCFDLIECPLQTECTRCSVWAAQDILSFRPMPRLLKQLTMDPELVDHYAEAFAKESCLKEVGFFDLTWIPARMASTS